MGKPFQPFTIAGISNDNQSSVSFVPLIEQSSDEMVESRQNFFKRTLIRIFRLIEKNFLYYDRKESPIYFISDLIQFA